ncbi:GAK system XXXCH domain-containing protein [Salidesulfovibrio brasiliensis]|uniref:GAK system XXXCH domain-containing protein n=1 Tax=Salidesulfovibrio brasiliensis TaxID=221711 RepID=UPI0006D1F2F0|nr:GAK system XXXCH domain-containing protein [Salidesulfovibrio brasiliensis]
MGKEIKIEKYIEKKDLITFFREIADAIEGSSSEELACFEDFKKVKISIKNEFGQMAVKAKIKQERECDATGEEAETAPAGEGVAAKPKYKDLKKRMKRSFKMIVKMTHDETLPPKEAVDSFLEDSELMVAYPGYGDEYYEDYTKACAEFAEAYKAEDMERLKAAVDELANQKGRCHAKYD